MKDYFVMPIKSEETESWLLYKHYAKRIPSISLSFGLYENKELIGVCTFGMTPNYIEMKSWEPFQILELNRLVVNEGLKTPRFNNLYANLGIDYARLFIFSVG